MDTLEVNRHDALLAIIAAGGANQLGRVQIQKAIFLLADEFEGCLPPNFYRFRKYDFGPFCHEIYQDAEMLSDWGQIHIFPGSERRYDSYRAAKTVRFEDIPLPAEMQDYIVKTVDWLKNMTFGELIRAIYLLFPEYRSNSKFSYSEEDAIAESFVRSFKQMRSGKVHDGREALEELRRETESYG